MHYIIIPQTETEQTIQGTQSADTLTNGTTNKGFLYCNRKNKVRSNSGECKQLFPSNRVMVTYMFLPQVRLIMGKFLKRQEQLQEVFPGLLIMIL